MRDKQSDALKSRQLRDQYLAIWYAKYLSDYIFLDSISDEETCIVKLQRDWSIDTIGMWKRNRLVSCFEEKIDLWPGYQRTNFALETESCTVEGKERKGWMKYAEADYLNYAFELEQGGLDLYVIDFPRLLKWFWQVPDGRGKPHVMEHTPNHTRFKKVPIAEVLANVPTVRYVLTDTGCTFKPLRGAA